MAKESNYSGHDHESASELARCLCDHLYECLPAEFSPRKHSVKNTCAAYVAGRNASLYWLYHYKYHVKVYLYGKYILDDSREIKKLMPPDVLLETRPQLRTNAEISMPCFFVLRTDEQSRSMGPVLRYLSEYRPKSSARSATAADTYWHSPSESADAEVDAAEEGTGTPVLVNKYERNVKNRKSCIKRYKAICSVCGFDFSVAYGEIGEGYIHVHHLTPLSASKGKSRKVDPIRDLRPVCPNCHEMLHRTVPPYTIEKLQEIMAAAKARTD